MKKILSNQRGIALMMIMTSIIILMAIYGDFTFDSKISRLKATNILDRSQAKLLAESGLQMAITRLRLYKEAYNTVQSKNLSQQVPAQLLNQLWEVPYFFPIPITEGSGRAFKDNVNKFTKESIIDGEIRVTVQNISNRLNLNMLRIDMQKIALQAATETTENDEYESTATKDLNTQTDFSVDQALFLTMKRLVDEKKEKDDAFGDRYGSLNYQDLFTNLKFYMSDFGTSNRDPNFGEAEQVFSRTPITPKFGPMTSASEIYAVPGWDDQLIELIQNEFSVYPTTQIDLNKITANFLKILVPNMTEVDIKEFFLYRDDPQNPKFFNSIGDFKRYIVEQGRLMSDTDFEARIAMFQKKGISFGSNPNLFKIVSEGISNRSTYTLVATVVLPKQEQAPTTATPPGQPPTTPPPTTPPTTPPAQNTQLLEPRIIELQIN
jgi:hypothetical protein